MSSTDSLHTYRKKRDFAKTPEPAGRAGRKRPSTRRTGGAYVIQKHAARALHYDFRLELDGVFKSWAVPKGPGLVPGEKSLAVHVEDHPLEYGDFEGVIPKGEYGGGTVMLWDRGQWRADEGSELDSGKLDFVLDGNKLKGAWSLVRMGGKKNADGKNWLLIKRHDPTARVVSTSELSVATGRSMDEIARARDRTWTRDGELQPKRKPRAKVKAPTRLKGSVRQIKVPAFVEPQLATLVSEPPEGAKWLHEIKFDGYRIVARIDGGKVRLFSRNEKDWTSRFPEIAEAIAELPASKAILDGEVVALVPNGASSFRLLQEALSSKRTARLFYQAFDLLHLDGYDLTGVAQLERKRALRDLLAADRFDPDGRLRYTDHIDGQGARFFEGACTAGLEGIVSKLVDAPYRIGRGRAWLKTKCTQHEELVIGGYTDPAGSRTGFGALLLGAFDADGKLIYMGRVGTGFDARQLEQIAARLTKLATNKSPFETPPAVRGVHWVRPRLVAEVEFIERTREGLLRHPSFRGLREDKDAKEILAATLAHVIEPPERAQPVAPTTPPSRTKTNADAIVAGVRVTHPDRVLWPERGITKLQLARYHEAIEARLMPQLANRPLALLRGPNGRTGDLFFQKHPGKTMSKDLPRVPIREKDKVETYMYVRELPDVIHLVQMGVLEFHVWGSHVDDLERPDIIVMDLDPDPKLPWSEVIRGAKALRERLDALGLASFPRVTGGKGLHVVVPLKPSADWDTVKAFSYAIAESVARDDPDRFTTNMAKSKRDGRIFIDYLRNGRGATAIASYSTRAREGAPVCVPLGWDELRSSTSPAAYDLTKVQKRLKTLRADPWRGFEESRRPLAKPKTQPRTRPPKRKSNARS